MRIIVSTVKTKPYATSKCLVKIIKPTLNRKKHGFVNQCTFAQETKCWEIYQEEVEVSYDLVNFHPTVPVD